MAFVSAAAAAGVVSLLSATYLYFRSTAPQVPLKPYDAVIQELRMAAPENIDMGVDLPEAPPTPPRPVVAPKPIGLTTAVTPTRPTDDQYRKVIAEIQQPLSTLKRAPPTQKSVTLVSELANALRKRTGQLFPENPDSVFEKWPLSGSTSSDDPFA